MHQTPTAAQLTQMLLGCVQPLGDVVFTKHNNHPRLLRDLRMPSQDIVGIVHDIVRRAVEEASTLGSLAYVETYCVNFPRNCFEPSVPLHFENAFLLTMMQTGVYSPRASIELEFDRGVGVHYMRVRLGGLVIPN